MSSLKRLRLSLTQDWTKRMKPVPLVYFARIPARPSREQARAFWTDQEHDFYAAKLALNLIVGCEITVRFSSSKAFSCETNFPVSGAVQVFSVSIFKAHMSIMSKGCIIYLEIRNAIPVYALFMYRL